MRRAVTLAELMVALALGGLVFALAWGLSGFMLRSERSTDREASRALAEARLMEQLLQDMRSAAAVQKVGTSEYQLKRHVTRGGKIELVPVVWKLAGPAKVVREEPGQPAQQFDFSAFIDPGDPPFKFQLEKVPDVTFQP